MNQNNNPNLPLTCLDNLLQPSDWLSVDSEDAPLTEVAFALMQDSPPQLKADMRARILVRVQQAYVSQTLIRRQLHFPKQAVLRWAAVFAVFIMLLTHAPSTPQQTVYGDAAYSQVYRLG